MKRLIFVSDSYSLSKSELEKFVYLLKEENLLSRHLMYIEKKINIELFLQELIKNKNVKQEKNLIIYNNKITKESTKLYLSLNEIYIETNKKETSLNRYFYMFCKNYLLID